jgi:hypothetical protein
MNPSIHPCRSLPGTASDRKAARGIPPIAAMSLSPRARQRWPTESGGCHARRKWMFSSVKSVVISASCPLGSGNTAQSSPMPSPERRLLPAARRIRSMTIFSVRGMRRVNIRERKGSRRAELIARKQAVQPSHNGVCLQYVSPVYVLSFIDTGILLCYGLMAIITYQSSSRPDVPFVCWAGMPLALGVSRTQVGSLDSTAKRSGFYRCGFFSRNQFFTEGY